MAATRKLSRITINFDDTGNVAHVEAVTDMAVTENALFLQGRKAYGSDYADLGAGAQTRVDAFVADVSAFITNQEPVV